MTVPTLRDVVIPVAAAYALLVGVVVYAVRHPDAGRPHEPRFRCSSKHRITPASSMPGERSPS